MDKKLLILIVLGLFTVIFLVLFAVSSLINRPSPPQDRPIFPTPTTYKPPETNLEITGIPDSTLTIPLKSPETGGGVDLEAQQTQASIQELEKIMPVLPYYQTHTLSTGVEVTISIPKSLLETRPWVLTVYIDGIDFHSPQDDPLYERARSSFRETASIVLGILQNNGVNTSVIFINWGGEAFIQDRAEMWLR